MHIHACIPCAANLRNLMSYVKARLATHRALVIHLVTCQTIQDLGVVQS